MIRINCFAEIPQPLYNYSSSLHNNNVELIHDVGEQFRLVIKALKYNILPHKFDTWEEGRDLIASYAGFYASLPENPIIKLYSSITPIFRDKMLHHKFIVGDSRIIFDCDQNAYTGNNILETTNVWDIPYKVNRVILEEPLVVSIVPTLSLG